MEFPSKNAEDYYRDALLLHFKQNRIAGINPDAAFFYGFNDDQILDLKREVPKALTQLSRPFVIVDCDGKTQRQIYMEAAMQLGRELPSNANVYVSGEAFVDGLLNSSCSLVVTMLSKAKATQKAGIARQFIKTLDDAHFKNFRAMSDVIFIDYASFLEKSWYYIGAYVRPVGAIDTGRMWLDLLSNATNRPTLVPV